MPRLLLAAAAKADLDDILDDVAQSNPTAALALLERLTGQLDRLAEHPQLGRPGRVTGTRELILAGTPYIAAYRVQGEVIQVLCLLHGARRWPRRM